MCSDHPIRELSDYKSITVLTECAGPVVILAPTYRALIKEVRLFFAGFDVRGQDAPTPIKENNTFKREGAAIGIRRQIAERG